MNIVRNARHDNEAHKVREWEATIRNFAGGRDGARAIEWARRFYSIGVSATLSGVLSVVYDWLVRGDTITADLEWRTK